MSDLRQREPRYENPDLIYAIRFLPCQIRIPGVCLGPAAATVACHSNKGADGKGKSMKAHDFNAAAGCDACHHEVDRSSKRSGPERKALLDEGIARTRLELFRRGMVEVAPAWRRTTEGDLVAQQNALSQLPIVVSRPRPRSKRTKTGHQNHRSTMTPAKCRIGWTP